MSDLYQEIILEEFAHPQHFYIMPDPDAHRHERNASCGDEVTVYIKMQDKGSEKVVTEISWQGNGCAISMASMSVLSAYFQGKTVASIQNATQKTVQDMLGLETISLGREKCLLLGLRALQKVTQQL